VAIVKPFRALRPVPERAAEVASVPYDVVSTTEARALAADNPLSFLHVSRPEIDLPDGVDPYSDQVYDLAAQNFERLMSLAPLIIEDEASFYLYRLRMLANDGQEAHEQTGLVACCSIYEYDEGVIRRHELTRRDKEDDRTRHMLTIHAQTGPVFLTYHFDQTAGSLMQDAARETPLFLFTAPDGVEHTIWKMNQAANQELIDAFGSIPALYIADGHHRAKSASRAHEALRDTNDAGESAFFQCVIFPSNQVRILAYNRVVKDLNGRTPEEFLRELAREFEVTEPAPAVPIEAGRFSVYLRDRWLGLRLRSDVTKRLKLTDRLDISQLQEHILGPLLGIKDQRTDPRIDFVGGGRGSRILEEMVADGRAAAAFSLYPTNVDDLIVISDAGEIMPPKSTWFEPKLRDGLLSHLI
jgi:uncharacterized protein (DUF1015 family)